MSIPGVTRVSQQALMLTSPADVTRVSRHALMLTSPADVTRVSRQMIVSAPSGGQVIMGTFVGTFGPGQTGRIGGGNS